MSDLFFTVMHGARQVMKAQAVNANNLANASTDGFQAELAYVQEQNRDFEISGAADFTPGNIRATGRSLDVAINGQGWMTVQTEQGTEGFSRRGDLKVDSLGLVTNGAGQPLIGNSGPISLPPFTNIEIGADGTISIQPVGQGPEAMAVIDRIKLVNPDPQTIHRGEDGVMRLLPVNGEEIIAPPDASVQLQPSSLESSNVNAVAEMLKMIDLSRRFETQIKLIQSADENSASLASLLRLN
ncbi:MAG: flagellar basal body rod protein FlgF [Pseudomonadota bacterium]